MALHWFEIPMVSLLYNDWYLLRCILCMELSWRKCTINKLMLFGGPSILRMCKIYVEKVYLWLRCFFLVLFLYFVCQNSTLDLNGHSLFSLIVELITRQKQRVLKLKMNLNCCQNTIINNPNSTTMNYTSNSAVASIRFSNDVLWNFCAMETILKNFILKVLWKKWR